MSCAAKAFVQPQHQVSAHYQRSRRKRYHKQQRKPSLRMTFLLFFLTLPLFL